MIEIRGLGVIAAVFAATWSLSCGGVDCAPGSTERYGHCMDLNADDEDDGDDERQSGDEADAAADSDRDDPSRSAKGHGSQSVSGGTAGPGRGSQSVSGRTAGNKSGAGSGNGGAGGGGAGGGAAAAGAGGMKTSGSGATAGEACTDEGAERCAMTGTGNREQCEDGTWSAGQPCASGETCVEDDGGPKCVLISELCRGSGGITICDAQGSLVVCNDDESISSMMACDSPKHCQAGIAAQTCAMCIPMEEHRCTEADLEQCAEDGMSFVSATSCQTAGLCNAMLGKCTDAVCEPGAKSCDGNNLVTCNEDGTAVADMERCTNGMCDAKGGDCNMCMPGSKRCEGELLTTCDATGQSYETGPCPKNGKCIGMGQCVACTGDGDCSDLTQGCKVGLCKNHMCMPGNAPSTTMCMASGGKPGRCSAGSCKCEPQCGNRRCGSNGCDGNCGSCTGGTKCDESVGQCVQCLRSSDCISTNVCMRGSCSNGQCRFDPLDSGRCLSLEGTGTCTDGRCCVPDCEGKCDGDSDGCQGRCTEPCVDQTEPTRDSFSYSECKGPTYSVCMSGGKTGVCHANGFCTPTCTERPQCPPLGGNMPECALLCQLPCIASCPNGMRCYDGVCGYRESQ